MKDYVLAALHWGLEKGAGAALVAALALEADGVTGMARVSPRTLAHAARLDERTLRRILPELGGAGRDGLILTLRAPRTGPSSAGLYLGHWERIVLVADGFRIARRAIGAGAGRAMAEAGLTGQAGSASACRAVLACLHEALSRQGQMRAAGRIAGLQGALNAAMAGWPERVLQAPLPEDFGGDLQNDLEGDFEEVLEGDLGRERAGNKTVEFGGGIADILSGDADILSGVADILSDAHIRIDSPQGISPFARATRVRGEAAENQPNSCPDFYPEKQPLKTASDALRGETAKGAVRGGGSQSPACPTRALVIGALELDREGRLALSAALLTCQLSRIDDALIIRATGEAGRRAVHDALAGQDVTPLLAAFPGGVMVSVRDQDREAV